MSWGEFRHAHLTEFSRALWACQQVNMLARRCRIRSVALR